MALGPSINDLYEDLMETNDPHPESTYNYVHEGGRLYAVGPFGRARIDITLTTVETYNQK